MQSNGSGAAERFKEFADDYLKELFKFKPKMASEMGLHEYDGQIPDLSREALDGGRVEQLNKALAGLERIDASEFDTGTRLDYDLLRQGISAELFSLDEQREHTYSPMIALNSADVSGFIKRDYAPAEERIARLVEYERGLPGLMRQHADLLEPPLARPLLEAAIEFCSGQVDYMSGSLTKVVAGQVSDPGLLGDFERANREATRAVEGYVKYLRGQLAGAKDDFAIGGEMFSRMLAVNELVDLPLEQVLEVGRANLEANKQAFIETARLIDPNKDVREVAADVADDHPTETSLIPDTAGMLEEIRQFLIDRDLITVPSEVRCKVEETPEFLRWGFAFMDSPGAFEQKATEAYYYVTPVEEEWSGTEKEEWLRRFNYSTLRDVSVHEAYPGHYVHFLHALGTTSPVRKTFGSYSFVEGWAHYCEQMMVEEGYRDESPLLHFAQLSEALLRNSRYVAAIMMHTGRMTLDEATRFFMDNGFMEELPARREAVRGTFDPGYLNYTLGKLLLLKLRDDVKARQGSQFNLKRFHDQVLSLGYPPVPLVRRFILGEGGSIL